MLFVVLVQSGDLYKVRIVVTSIVTIIILL